MLKLVVTRSSRCWFDWQTQQADRRKKVTEEQQHKLGGGLGDAESRDVAMPVLLDRKSTRLNSSHVD